MNETKTCMVREGRGIHRNQQNKEKKRNRGTTPRHNASKPMSSNWRIKPEGIPDPLQGHLATNEMNWTPGINAETPRPTMSTTRTPGTTTASTVDKQDITPTNANFP